MPSCGVHAPVAGLPALVVRATERLLLRTRVPRTTMAKRQVHSEARGGFGGGNASFYEKTRPGYPATGMRAIETEILRCGVSNGADLLIDLGCGTGKFTREILPFAKAEGLPLVGIEPVEAMRKQFEDVLPGVLVSEGTGENLPLLASSARAVIAAQCFHWMASTATLREVHRVLAPGGLFVLVWNTRDCSRPWVRALEDIIDPFYGDNVPRQQGGAWKRPFQDLQQRSSKPGSDADGNRPGPLFGELTEKHFQNSQLLTADELDGRMRSISVIATRPETDRRAASRRARELIETHPDTRDDLRSTGKVELFYDTEVYWCRKLGAPSAQQ